MALGARRIVAFQGLIGTPLNHTTASADLKTHHMAAGPGFHPWVATITCIDLEAVSKGSVADLARSLEVALRAVKHHLPHHPLNL